MEESSDGESDMEAGKNCSHYCTIDWAWRDRWGQGQQKKETEAGQLSGGAQLGCRQPRRRVVFVGSLDFEG